MTVCRSAANRRAVKAEIGTMSAGAGVTGASPRMLTALVTGGNRGLGLEVARGILAAAPTSHVLLGSRDLAAGQVAAAELAREYGAPLLNTLNGVD